MGSLWLIFVSTIWMKCHVNVVELRCGRTMFWTWWRRALWLRPSIADADVPKGPFTQTPITVLVSVCAALVVLTFIPPLAPATQPVPIDQTMTYNGMTLAQFAVQIGMPHTDSYVIALFEELCMTT